MAYKNQPDGKTIWTTGVDYTNAVSALSPLSFLSNKSFPSVSPRHPYTGESHARSKLKKTTV
jgi:hypothetical protein